MAKRRTMLDELQDAFSTMDVMNDKIDKLGKSLTGSERMLYQNIKGDAVYLLNLLKRLRNDLEKTSNKRKEKPVEAPKTIKVQIWEHEFGMRPEGVEMFATIEEAKAYVKWFNSNENPKRKGGEGQYWSAELSI